MANEKRLIAENDIYALFEENGTARLHVGHIDALPRVDAVEVVHGRWIYEEEPDGDNNIQARCSVCFAGDKHATALMHKVPYCWKCGAKMDGGINHE